MIKIYNVKLESIIGIFKNIRTKKKNPQKQQTESMDTEDGTQNNDKNEDQTPDTRKQNADQSSDSDSKNGYGANDMNGSLSGTQTEIGRAHV